MLDTRLSILLADKGSTIHSISSKETAYEASMKMNHIGVGALLVIDEGELMGIISERDIIRKIIGPKKDATVVLVAEIMTKKLVTVLPITTVQEAMRIITERRFRHLPVLDKEKLVGIISIGDLTRWVMLQQESEIGSLTSYIQGNVK